MNGDDEIKLRCSLNWNPRKSHELMNDEDEKRRKITQNYEKSRCTRNSWPKQIYERMRDDDDNITNYYR